MTINKKGVSNEEKVVSNHGGNCTVGMCETPTKANSVDSVYCARNHKNFSPQARHMVAEYR